MKKHYAKLVIVLLVASMFVNILSACKKNEGDNASKSSTKSASAKVSASSTKKNTGSTSKPSTSMESTLKSSENTASATKNNDPISENDQDLLNVESEFVAEISEKFGQNDIDLGGKTVIITVGSTSTANLPVPSTAELSAVNFVWVKKAEAAEKKYNFKFDCRTVPKLTEELAASTLAGIRMTDILFTSLKVAFPNFVSKDLILPLDEYLDYEQPIFKVSPFMYKSTLWKGKHYGIKLGGSVKNASCLLFYNKDILDREGQPDINELTEKNQWTWEKMESIAVNCTRDIDGDGILDQYGIATQNSWEFLKNILYSNGVTGIDFDSNNNMVYSMNSPQALRALQFTVDLAFVDKVFVASRNPYINGTCAMCITNDLSVNAKWITQGIPSYVAALPMGSDVNDYQNFGSTNFYALSSMCENPDAVAKMFAEISILWDENLNDNPELAEAKIKFLPDSWIYDPANTSSRYFMGENESRIQSKIAAKFVPDYSSGIPNLSTIFDKKLAAPIFSGQKSVGQAVDSIKSEVQAILNEYNN